LAPGKRHRVVPRHRPWWTLLPPRASRAPPHDPYPRRQARSQPKRQGAANAPRALTAGARSWLIASCLAARRGAVSTTAPAANAPSTKSATTASPARVTYVLPPPKSASTCVRDASSCVTAASLLEAGTGLRGLGDARGSVDQGAAPGGQTVDVEVVRDVEAAQIGAVTRPRPADVADAALCGFRHDGPFVYVLACPMVCCELADDEGQAVP